MLVLIFCFGVAFVRVDELVKRMEDELAVLELIIRNLRDLGEALKRLVNECKSQCDVSVETVQGMIPEKLHAYLGLGEEGEYVTVNINRRLNVEQFKAVVAFVIRRLGGEYVSLGGTGYFMIPKRRT
jgi:uncharacterized protein with HEPN domain